MTNKLMRVVLSVVGLIMAGIPALAQTAAAESGGIATGYRYLAAGLGMALAAGLAALGQGRIAGSACEGAARNPSAAGRIQVLMILGLAFVETLVIFTLVVVFVVLRP